MKLPESILANVACSYAYNHNGAVSLALLHREQHAKTKVRIEWITIHATDIQAEFAGRIVIHRRGALRILLASNRVTAKPCTIEGGSENTKKHGIPVGYISFQLGRDRYDDSFHVNLMDGMISTDFSYQPESRDTLDPTIEHDTWGMYQVVNQQRKAA